ncbi:GNAT family N-acetyltransferase [Streptomyces sp. 4N509B]|uniref:GNAT family N-acetyltransferase n=1 Tax=Streptomyces sp. 4N509B TaxID=3457413 RepID=UPI003FD2C5D0
MRIVPLEDGFVEQAAALLSRAHAPAAAGAEEGAGGWDIADAEVARRAVAGWWGTGPAVAAVRDGGLVGFMAAVAPAFPGEPTARVRLTQHASVVADRRAIYRALYEALSGQLTAIGAFSHTVAVPAGARDTVTCFFELGFGVDQIRGFRPVPDARTPEARPPAPRTPDGAAAVPGVRLRPARGADVDRLLELTVELQHFHALPPALRPALVDPRAIRDGFLAALGDDRQLLLVAERRGQPVGMMQAGPDSSHTDAATIGIAVVTASSRLAGVGSALLSGVGEWARERGFRRYGAEWTSANRVSDAFWRGRGMVPTQLKLTRLIDSRVAWADAAMTYDTSPRARPRRARPRTARTASPAQAAKVTWPARPGSSVWTGRAAGEAGARARALGLTARAARPGGRRAPAPWPTASS